MKLPAFASYVEKSGWVTANCWRAGSTRLTPRPMDEAASSFGLGKGAGDGEWAFLIPPPVDVAESERPRAWECCWSMGRYRTVAIRSCVVRRYVIVAVFSSKARQTGGQGAISLPVAVAVL